MLVGLVGLSGCGTHSGITLTGVQSGTSLTLEPQLSVYRFSDKNTADVYMTDLPKEVFDPQADLSGVSGQLTHVHLFVAPEAGKTPIDDTACSVTVRHVVVAQGQIGVYGGGGFMYPDKRPGREYFRGNIAGATLRLVAATPGFDNKLGAAELQAGVDAQLDEPMAGALAERLRSLVSMATPTLREEPKAPAKAPAAAEGKKGDAKADEKGNASKVERAVPKK